jgi:hypothetical protein
MKRFGCAVAATLTALVPCHALALDLRLKCEGVGSMAVPNVTSAYVSGTNGSASGSVISERTRQMPEFLSVEISGETARVHVPRSLLPPIHGGGQNDWWDLKELTITDTEISGRFSLNFINKPMVRIDRTTGSISVDGFKEAFRGTCAVEDPTARKF